MGRWILCFSMIFLLLIGCSSTDEHSSESADMAGSDHSASKIEEAPHEDSQLQGSESSQLSPLQAERKVVFNANLSLTVEDLPQATDKLNELTSSYKGYVVEESTYTEGESVLGSMTVRIPQGQFYAFLDKAEAIGKGLSQKSITGSDVTEQYIDLNSRLKAKEAVMKRLQGFLNEATKTEDLLSISNDLSRVQEEIEQLKGQINYLDNQSEFSTVSLSLEQQKISVPTFAENELSTFTEAKKLFMTTANGLLSFGSKSIVFLIGLSPIFLPLLAVGLFFYIRYRKKTKKVDQNL
ncbi:DUF4349 domain-containing protein [Alkalihalobacillus macyae]|uniref:DUF4349 domain-containing protein n=1 Tax=Guptibacillus hwajinpoensis TaxID=208199 RepID=UPI00273BD2ED|nr:DUF4349 domain-containing protein [Alkalihalobacillus macyae]MDP4552498.1 DUF4349 domain-containing protein [Alkalihalobacillus macyae]